MRKWIGVLLPIILLTFIPAYSANSIKSGAVCNKLGTTKNFQGKKYTCIKSGKKLIWSKGVALAKPSASPAVSPLPTSSPAATATLIPSVTSTPSASPTVLSLAERWNQTGSQALVVYDKWAAVSDGKTPSVKVTYLINSNLWPETERELKRRMSNVIAYFDPYFKPELPIYFVSGRFEDMEWACAEIFKLDSGRGIEGCRRESLDQQRQNFHDSWGGGIGKASAHWYLLKMKEAIDARAFLPRIEHEYIHTIQQNQIGNYGEKVACWYHGMAEYLGILASAQGNLEYFLDQRNTSILNAPTKRPEQLTMEFLTNWIIKASVIQFVGGQFNCREYDQTGDYHDAILAAEWMVLKLGLPGVLAFQADLKNMSWNEALEKSFKLKPTEIYEQIGKYMFYEIQISRANSWVRVQTCRGQEPGPVKEPLGCKF